MANNVVFLMNYRNERDMYPPFGIMYVADALSQLGFEARIFHETEAYQETFLREVAGGPAAVRRLEHHHRPAAAPGDRDLQAAEGAGRAGGVGRGARHHHARRLPQGSLR